MLKLFQLITHKNLADGGSQAAVHAVNVANAEPHWAIMAAPTGLVHLEWAKSLVGREWEIFWEEEKDDAEENETGGDTEVNGEKAKMPHLSSTSMIMSHERPASLPHISSTTTDPMQDEFWACDVCEMPFPNYDEAVRHEEQCRREKEQGGRQRQASVVAAPQTAANVTMATNLAPQLPQQQQQVGAVSVLNATATVEMNGSERKQHTHDGSKQKKHDDEENDEEYSDSEEEVQDVTDWYDATVIGFDQETQIFKISFVGDDDTIYEMPLKPAIVRPCIRAWAKRSKAILEGHYKGEVFDFSVWEKQLPVDTATLEDRNYLEQQWNGAFAQFTTTATADGDSFLKDRKDIIRLCFLVQSQIYLRRKLAPVVVDSKAEPGVAAMSDAYLDHLVKCLQELQHLCIWYEDCSFLHEKVVPTASEVLGRPSEIQSGATPLYAPGSSLFNVEYIRGYCLEKGRAMINNLLSMDFSRAGAKRRPVASPAAPSARKAKRRKGYKASGFLQSRQNQDEDVLFMEEGEFMSLKSVKKFVNKLDQHKWFVCPLLRMLQRLCSEVQEPMRLWKREVDVVLGEESDSDDSDSSSSEDEKEHENADEAGNDMKVDDLSSDDDKERYFTCEEITLCLDKARSDRILSKFDLSQWTSKLQEKLSMIEVFEVDVWRVIPRVVDDVGESTKTSDDVLARLRQLREAAQSTNVHVKNVEPLGRANSRLTRTVIDNAIAVREWVLDLRHADLVRERLSFVQDVVSRAPTLPHVPAPPHGLVDESLASGMASRLGQAMSGRIPALSSKLYSHVHVFSRYENIVADSNSTLLCSEVDVRAALDELRATPVISLVEEKLSIRLDVLKWRDLVRGPLDSMRRDGLEYVLLEGLKRQLDIIVNGSSPSRTAILNDLEKNVGVDNDIRQFATNEIIVFCAEEAATIERLYLKAKDWRDRADSIILALRIYGNPTAGSSLSNSNKSAAMVDLKRVDDLLAEYEELGSTMEEKRELLRSIREETTTWCSNVEKIIVDDNNVLERLTVARDARPKGVLMDPARHIVDSWIELLEWHNRVNAAFRGLISSSKSIADGPDSAAGDSFSTLIADMIYPLMLEGQEVVSRFSRQGEAREDGSFSPDDALTNLFRFHENHKPLRTLSVWKLESSQLGSMLLSRIVDHNRDAMQGSPLLCLLFLAWRVAVIDLIHRQSATERIASKDAQRRPTLEEAKELSAIQPCLPPLNSQDNTTLEDGMLPFHCLFSRLETAEVAKFRQLISDAERVETATRLALPATKEIVRGSFDKAGEVRDHLAKLKQLQADFKSRLQERSGLILSSALEQSLDSVVKDVAWLVRTFPYAALHSDTLHDKTEDLERDEDPPQAEETHSAAIPWDVLVSLHERVPDPTAGLGGDLARVSLRVKELFEVANTWQEEVTSQLSLSYRGGAKRGAAIESDDAPKINLGRLAQLAEHPILARVSMPREDAVQRVLDRAREFEESLAGLLGVDFEGNSADKTAYPESDSLVAKNGDFLLYRLTGSTLFAALKTSLEKMSPIAADVLADTPGKSAFDWIVKAVAWIDDLSKAVDDISSFKSAGSKKLVIPSSDAKRLLDRGHDLFIEFTDDLRRTLAVHKISLSTNKQTERLTVVIGKGGALHSVGGTAIKWCPLLLEWLKADVERQRDWESRAIGTGRSFHEMTSKYNALAAEDKETIYRWLQFRDRVSLLVDEGRDSLVVTPQKTIVTNLLNLQSRLDAWVDKIMTDSKASLGVDAKTLIKGRFEDGGPAVEDRYSLLDALLKRRQLDEDVAKRKGVKSPRKPTSVPAGPSSRDKARSILERALSKGVRMMGIADGSDSSIFCAMKAWEIEEAMFAEFRKEIGTTAVTDKYIEKLRSLRYNLEDTNNPTLCPRVLVGEISVNHLVNMTSEEMASQKIRLKKAKAEEESKKNIILNPGAVKPKEDQPTRTFKLKSTLQGYVQPGPSPPDKKSVLKEALNVTSPNLTRPIVSLPRPSPPGQLETASDNATTPSPRQGRPTLKLGSLLSPTLPPPPLGVKTSRQAALLSTPPSLAMAPPPSMAAAPTVTASQRNAFVRTSNGGDTFSVSVADSTRIFKVKLVLTDESQRSQVDEMLPELLTEKGRNRIAAFSEFLNAKLDTGRWVAISMRLTTVSDNAANDNAYKKYYKDYEKKERISMFSIGKESKLFLVTPKFHGAASPLKFENRTSTYAVLLMRSRKFID